jgi:hypothetical protein
MACAIVHSPLPVSLADACAGRSGHIHHPGLPSVWKEEPAGSASLAGNDRESGMADVGRAVDEARHRSARGLRVGL